MAGTEVQIREQAQVIASQAQALADGMIPEGQRYAQVARLKENIDTLSAWVPDDRR